ncbi:MAG: type II secretion system protein [Vulcanimicrobiota bacterium]
MVKQRGFTMMELVIYIGLSAILLGLVAAFFQVSRRQYESASTSYLIGQEATTALQWIKRDLQETALSTIRVELQSEGPTMSMIATSEDSHPRSFKVSPYGTPEWNRYAFYALDKEGNLHRWDRPLADLDSPKRLLPLPATANSTDSNGGVNKKVLLRGVMVPGQKIQMDGKDAPFPEMTEWGGFKPGFVIYDKDGKDHLTAMNPAEITEARAEGSPSSVETLDGETIPLSDLTTSGLLEVQVAIKLEGFRDNSPSAVMVPIRVAPQH